MSEKLSKTIQNIDNYFSEVNLCRKAIVHDDSCLFRAVSEKLFFTQCYHERVKATCLDYMERHAGDYEPFMLENMKDIIKQLKCHERSAGHLEMIIMSRIYRMDFFVYHPSTFEQFNMTQNMFQNKIYLCYAGDGHYDLVYSKDFQQSIAVCQSLLYELLYHSVFGLEAEAEEAVVFLHIKKYRECSVSDVVASLGKEKLPVLERLSGRTFPPLPYRVAKALHPCIYRNVEYDIVHEQLREAKISKQTCFDNFSIGDKCQVFVEDEDNPPYHGHIQQLDVHQGTCVVYVEELAVKKCLPARCIGPLPVRPENQGNSIEWPVAEIDLVRFQKRGRRRKTSTALVLGDHQRHSQTDALLQPQDHPSPPPPRHSPDPHTLTFALYDEWRRLVPNPPPSSDRTPPPPLPTLPHQLPSYPPHHNLVLCHRNSPPSLTSHPDNQCCLGDLDGGQYNGHRLYVDTDTQCGHHLQHPAQTPGIITDSPDTLWDPNATCLPPSPPQVLLEEHGCPGSVILTALPPFQPSQDPMSVQPHTPQGPAMFVMPMMALPYGGQVNVAWGGHAHEQTDDNNTPVRFVSNTGVEYYRMCSQMNTQVGGGGGGYSTLPPGPSPTAMYQVPPPLPPPPHNTAMGPGTTDTNVHYCSMPVPVYPSSPPQSVSMGAGFVPTTTTTTSYPKPGENSHNSDNSVTSSTSCSSSVYPTTNHQHDGLHRNEDGSTGSCQADNPSSNNSKISSKSCSGGVGGLKDKAVSSGLRQEEKQRKESKGGKTGAEEDRVSDGGDHMDVGSDGDSGCPSECTDLSPVSVPDNEFVDSTTTTTTSVVELSNGEVGKPRGKRRYYMYGNHKLIKPIKEIPQRFQTLLSETRAAKARCEGQPIYMQPSATPTNLQPYDIVYYQTPGDDSQQQAIQPTVSHMAQQPLNANANCFVPGQGSDSSTLTFMTPDEMAMCPMGDYGNPSQMFVPPMGPNQSSQSGPTIIVYSNQSPATTSSSSSSTSYLPQTPMIYSRPSQHMQSIPMPPPPFPPPPSMPPPSYPLSKPSMPPPHIISPDSKPKPSKPISLSLNPPYKPHSLAQSPMSMDGGSSPQSFLPPPHPLPTAAAPCVSSVPTSQYMYVYPSTPTGGATNPPPQGPVMYMMTSPPSFHQQQGMVVPSVQAQ